MGATGLGQCMVGEEGLGGGGGAGRGEAGRGRAGSGEAGRGSRGGGRGCRGSRGGGGEQRGVSEEIVCHSLEARRVVERGEGINQHIICVVIWGGRGEAAPEQQRQVQRRTLSSAPRRRAASWPADPA